MRAAVLRGIRRIEIEDRPVPIAGPGDVLVAIQSVAICGSDLHGFEGLIPERRPVGITMGHEFAGTVAAVGAGASRVREGDRVAIDPQISCGRCNSCLRGWPNLCEHTQIVGSAMRGYRHGANAEFVAVPATNAYRLPEGLSFDEGAMAEPVGNALHLVRRAGVTAGSRVVIIGAGAIGSIAVQASRVFGASQVIVVEPAPFKRERALAMGAHFAIDPRAGGVEEQVRAQTSERGADIVLECCGVAATYQLAVRLAGKRGTVGALGFVDEEIPFPMRKIIFSEVSVVGSTGFYWPDDPALEMMADGRIDVKPLISRTFPLAQAQGAYEAAAAPDSIKIIINP